MRIALAGNPNCGKTTLFNALTGRLEKVGNWSGVTVVQKTAKLKRKYVKIIGESTVIDLPGAYGIHAYSDDEQEAVDFVKGVEVDVIIDIIEARNLERGLNFTLELKELNIPMVAAINKIDQVKSKNKIDLVKLENLLEMPVVGIRADKRKGLKELFEAILKKEEK